MTKKKLYLYDFDGTVTHGDSLLAFIRYACGLPRMLLGFLLYSPMLVLMKCHLYDNGHAKQHLFAHFFRGWTLLRFNETCREFARDRSDLIRRGAKQSLATHLMKDGQVMIVSASVDNWVVPFFHIFYIYSAGETSLTVVGTQIEVADERLTGRFLTPNCYGPEKVHRVQALLTEPRDHYFITAYGDSRGDREMLNFADESHYKPFR